MKMRTNENNMSFAGDVLKEMSEIQKMQTAIPYYLTIVTNTCSGITSVVCC